MNQTWTKLISRVVVILLVLSMVAGMVGAAIAGLLGG